MNTFMKGQILSMINTARMFEDSCELAARRDDGRISREEQKTLDQISSLTEKYRKELQKICDRD